MLTDQEIEDIGKEHAPYVDQKFARAIESAATAPLLGRIAEQTRTIECLNSIINDHGPTTENVTVVGRLEARIADLERQLEEARKDAQRYRWFIESAAGREICFLGDLFWTKEELDAAIDAAIKEQTK